MMHFLILLLLGLATTLFITFKIFRNVELRRYLIFLLIIDIWLSVVLMYLLFNAAFDL